MGTQRCAKPPGFKALDSNSIKINETLCPGILHHPRTCSLLSVHPACIPVAQETPWCFPKQLVTLFYLPISLANFPPRSLSHFSLLHQNTFICQLSFPKQDCLVFLQPLSLPLFCLQVVKLYLMRKFFLHIYLFVHNESSKWSMTGPIYFISYCLQTLLGYYYLSILT